MITCPHCSGENWRLKHKDVLNPANDVFHCVACNKNFLRYDEPKKKSGCPYCGAATAFRQDKDAFFTDAYISVPATCTKCGEDVVVMYDFKEILPDI